jgi:dihydrofolate reductase
VGALWATEEAWGVEGRIPEPFLWTALDCPAQFAYMNQSIKTGLMGRMTAEILSHPVAGQTLIVSAWTTAIEGKKHFAGSAIFDLDQTLLARAITVWIGGEPLSS